MQPPVGAQEMPLLRTKLYIPPLRPGLVPRPRLIEQLSAGLDRKLSLVSAPAGFGKTTLVSEWVVAQGQREPKVRTAWLSLDESDNDPTRFLSYLIAALQAALQPIEVRQERAGSFGQGALSVLRSPQPPPAESVLTALINEVAVLTDRIVLVLDDYHLIEAQPIHNALGFLLQNLPPASLGGLHLIIATREDPPLSLARLRARGQLTELRATDLRFTSLEAAEFLNQAVGLELSVKDIATLEARTEGWIAGLQLASLALQGSLPGRGDTARRIASFGGSHRFVLDYLIEEVLEQQSQAVQAFLLETAVLNRLTGSLCDAVTDRARIGQHNGRSTLEMLEHANLFIVPLDDERHWYRYHHLFAELLRRRLRQTQPEQVPVLHARASKWYEQNGLIEEAIEHALHAKDSERAAYLVESVADTVWARGEDAKLRRWLDGLPAELVLSKPQLCIFRAWELFVGGQQDAAERLLEAAELAPDRSTDCTAETGSLERDQPPRSSRPKVRGRAAAIRAWMAAYRTDIPGIIRHSRQALQDLPEDDLNWRSAAAITLGDTYHLSGDFNAAYQARVDAMDASEAAGNTYLYMAVSAKLALTLKAQGQLLQVKEICRHRLQLANERGMSQTAVVGWLSAIWGEVLAETGDPDVALDLVTKGVEWTERGADVVMLGWSCLCLTRVLFSRGDIAGAEVTVQKLDRVARESVVPIWIMNLNAAWQARIWLAQDRLDAACQWVKDRGLSPDIEPTYVDGLRYIALARVMIAQGRGDETTTLLQRMLEPAQVGGDVTRAIEIMMLLALAFYAEGETIRAITTLERALTLAEPGGYIRIFVDEGPPMGRLLYKTLSNGSAGRGTVAPYVRRLLAAFPLARPEPAAEAEQTVSSETLALEPELIEPLSERELEILGLIAEGLSNAEIASRLFLTLNTVKSHASNIYGKLGVHSRTQAVAKARALGLLSPT